MRKLLHDDSCRSNPIGDSDWRDGAAYKNVQAKALAIKQKHIHMRPSMLPGYFSFGPSSVFGAHIVSYSQSVMTPTTI